MQTPAIAVCLLQCLLPVFVLADNVALNPSDVLRDGDYTSCKPVTWADFFLTANFDVTHIRVYTTETQHVTVYPRCVAQPIRSSSFVDFFCATSFNTNRIVINNLRGSTCEIEVGTCSIGSDGKRYYGADCREPCSDSCHAGLCDSNRGTCSCEPGTTGSYCDEVVASTCPDDYYGQNCNTRCPSDCPQPSSGSRCDVSTGYCTQPCLAGRRGDKCDQACDFGTYGAGDSTMCPSQCGHCKDNSCQPTDGHCTSGCEPGWQSPYCQQACDDNHYGENCASECSRQCRRQTRGRVCDAVSGACTACPAGWSGNDCTTECDNDHYGDKCLSTCSSYCSKAVSGRVCDAVSGACTACDNDRYGDNCLSPCSHWCKKAVPGRLCDAVSGACTACPPGKTGNACTADCDDDRYGENCASECSSQCRRQTRGRVCDAVSGACTACPAGWSGNDCTTACSGGYYGMGCRERCPSCGQPGCDPVTGDCIGLCRAGSWGPRCEKGCAGGTFGRGNRTSCPHSCSTCKASACYETDGWCKQGCIPGYKSNYCNQTCDDGTFGDCRQQCACRDSSEVCNKHSGLCQSGCRDGRMGDNCQQECPHGFFGTCTIRCLCRDAGEACDKETGDCRSGCPDGRSGSNCYDCQAGVYGEHCNRTCNCRNSTEPCDAATGVCTSGCPTGWQGSDCQNICEEGVFGDNCGSTCHKNCANSSCHHVTGFCKQGCVGEWKGDSCTEMSSSAFLPGVIIPIVVGILLIIGFGVFWFRRRSKGKQAGKDCEENAHSRRHSGLASNHDNVEEENEGAAVSSNPATMEAVYSNAAPVARPSHVIAVSELKRSLVAWRADDHFSTQFQSLPQGLTEPHAAAYSAENKGKNRYANICAYDHSRVKLSVPPGSGQTDYINACFVDGYKSPRRFIASQGPNDVIINDFVRMLLEHDVSTVVMLTNLYEDGKPKCNQYWPEKTEAVFGGITVTMTSVVTRRDYVIRNLTLSTKGGERSVNLRHFHFLSWPDKGVPASPWPLLDFRDVAMENAPPGRPVVVHCSAGIGRTGTFIAMDVLLRQAQAEGSIDVLQCVTALRQARTHMVQTVEQYGFLHEVALVGLCAAESVLPNEVFLQRYPNLLSPSGSKSPAAKEFQKLSQCPFDISDKEVAMGNQPENKDKNVDPNILPVAGARVQLMTSIPDSNGYINAIFISDYDGRDKFILTQTPAANTVREFWAMVADFNVTAIVTLDSSPDKAYWPEKEEDFGPSKVQVLPPTDAEHFLVSCATVIRDGNSISVKRFQLKKMPESLKAKSDPQPLVTLREEVDKVKGDGPVLVHSRDGAGLGGLYCVLSVLLRRAVKDRVVALPYSLSLVKRLRPQVVQSQGEYEFLYVAAKYHLDHYQPSPDDVSAEDGQDENIYANQEAEAVYGNE